MLSFYLAQIIDESDQSKFEQIYCQHRHTMLYVAQSILNDSSLAEDAVHEAFLRVLNHLKIIYNLDRDKVRAYLVVIVRNIAIDQYRKRKQLAEYDLGDYEEFLADDGPDPEQNWIETEDRQKIVKALSKIDQSYADLLALQVAYKLSVKEIADMLNLSTNSVRMRLYRGRKQLAHYLKEVD